MGPRALRPPPPSLEPPDALADLDSRRPARDAAGAPVPDAPASLAAIEDVDPSKLAAGRAAGARWEGTVWRDGAARGLAAGGGWAWVYRDRGRWWAVAGPERSALARHDGVWWLKERGVWYVVHDGEPWAWRPFHDWDAQGLFQPGSGTEMVYSADFKRVAVIAPGEGAEVFDAASGELVARVPEARLPPRRRPRAPRELSPPPDAFAR